MIDRIKYYGGIPSICSAHPAVIKTAFQTSGGREVLIESTCNQVNQFGGYTGMTPADFASFVAGLADETGIPQQKIILGGDHLGPGVWRDKPANHAMALAIEMVRDYVRAGYTKLHLDCSQPMKDDPPEPPAQITVAGRAAVLAHAAEEEFSRIFGLGTENPLRYVIGTEVPLPGGSVSTGESPQVTRTSDAEETIEYHRKAFINMGLSAAWDRILALVVQPGVEFGDDFVAAYQPEKTRELVHLIRGQGLVYEAHSTDYQTSSALAHMVRDRFSILKVGPALTFAYRAAIFTLALIENELVPFDDRSNIIQILDDVMVRHPNYWQNYYTGSVENQAFKRKYSLSDRIRYYWIRPEVQQALGILLNNLSGKRLPPSLVSMYTSQELIEFRNHDNVLTPDDLISSRISQVLGDYWDACAG